MPLENLSNWYLRKPLLLFKILPLLAGLKDLEFAMAEKKNCYNSRHCLQKLPKTSKTSKTMQRKHKLLVAFILILTIAIYFAFSILLSVGNER